MDERLLRLLADYTPLPITYAGGIATMADVELVHKLGACRVDATVGSALDIFGGTGITYRELVAFHEQQS